MARRAPGGPSKAKPGADAGPAAARSGGALIINYGAVRQRDGVASRCELPATWSMVVTCAGAWPAEVGKDHPKSDWLLHSRAALQ